MHGQRRHHVSCSSTKKSAIYILVSCTQEIRDHTHHSHNIPCDIFATMQFQPHLVSRNSHSGLLLNKPIFSQAKVCIAYDNRLESIAIWDFANHTLVHPHPCISPSLPPPQTTPRCRRIIRIMVRCSVNQFYCLHASTIHTRALPTVPHRPPPPPFPNNKLSGCRLCPTHLSSRTQETLGRSIHGRHRSIDGKIQRIITL